MCIRDRYENTIYFGDEQGTFHAVDIQTNQKKWIFQADAGIISSANFIDDRILFGSYDQCLYCLDAKTGVLIWKFETEGYVHGAPAIVDNLVVTSGCDGYLRIINTQNSTSAIFCS